MNGKNCRSIDYDFECIESLFVSYLFGHTRTHEPTSINSESKHIQDASTQGKRSMTPRCWLVIVIKRKKNLPLIFKICLYIFSVITASSLLIIFLFYFWSRCQPWSSKCFKSINQVK